MFRSKLISRVYAVFFFFWNITYLFASCLTRHTKPAVLDKAELEPGCYKVSERS